MNAYLFAMIVLVAIGFLLETFGYLTVQLRKLISGGLVLFLVLWFLSVLGVVGSYPMVTFR